MRILTGFDCRLVGFSILVRKIQKRRNFSLILSKCRTIHGEDVINFEMS